MVSTYLEFKSTINQARLVPSELEIEVYIRMGKLVSMELGFKVYWDQCNMVPRCIHINMSRMTETLVARFIGELVCWDQVKQVNGRMVELESTRMGTWVNWFMDQMNGDSLI